MHLAVLVLWPGRVYVEVVPSDRLITSSSKFSIHILESFNAWKSLYTALKCSPFDYNVLRTYVQYPNDNLKVKT